MFHNLLFLGPGGRTVFQGGVEEAARYFEGLGFTKPENVNPADYYMDVIGGQYTEEGVDKSKLFEEYESYQCKRDGRSALKGDCNQAFEEENSNIAEDGKSSKYGRLQDEIHVEVEQPGEAASQGIHTTVVLCLV